MRSRCLSSACKGILVNPQKISSFDRFDAECLRVYLAKEFSACELTFSLTALRKIPHFLRRKQNFKVVLVQDESMSRVADLVEESCQVLGVAVDLGSTTIAFYVYDFENDRVLSDGSILNPQIAFGEDILSRLNLARKTELLEEIRRQTLSAINKVLERLSWESVYFLSLCGNTAMTHLFLGLPVNYMIFEPYPPVAKWYGIFRPEELGLRINPEGRVFVFPSAGAYFGGDLISGLFYIELHKKERPSFFIDVGTNAEVVLGNRDFLLACAGAAGPALEGGVFEVGCRAGVGAIHRIFLEPKIKQLSFEVIGGGTPKCLCGSAVIDLMAQLFLAGFLSPEGKLHEEKWPKRIFDTEEGRAFLVYEDERNRLMIKESEIKAFLRSKGAMFSILSLLCEKTGLTFKDVEHFYFAGTFGVNIDVWSAVVLGMLPDEALEKAKPVGNSAGLGALKFLQETNFESLRGIVDSITYLELNTEPRFMEILTAALFIPNVNLDLFPRVKKLLNRS